MEVADDRDFDAEFVKRLGNYGNGLGCFFGVDGNANQLGAGTREGHDLINGSGGIGCVRIGHGLDDDRMIAADPNSAYVHRNRFAPS